MDNTQTLQPPSILKTTREAKGVNLEMVHEATKIPLDALRAIEQGYTTRNVSPFYHRGFIKIYAQFLELDIDTVLREYKMQETVKFVQTPPNTLTQERFQDKGQEYLKSIKAFFTPQVKRWILQGLAVVFGLWIFLKAAGFVGHSIQTAWHNMSTQKNSHPRAKEKKNPAPVCPSRLPLPHNARPVPLIEQGGRKPSCSHSTALLLSDSHTVNLTCQTSVSETPRRHTHAVSHNRSTIDHNIALLSQ